MDRIYRTEHRGAPRHVVERDGGFRLVEGDVYGEFQAGDVVRPSRFLAPVEPSKIVAVGLNYRDHAAETNKAVPDEPLIFLKPSTAVIGPGDPIRIPPGVGRVDHEAEAAIVIRRPAFRVTRERARDYILGLTCLNDVTARDLQTRDVQFTRSKGFDTFAPIGPCIVQYQGGPVAVEALVNGVRRQASSTRELIFGIEDLIVFISSVMTLLPGDVISTGTPSGIAPIVPGDSVTIRVEGVGDLTNPVVAG